MPRKTNQQKVNSRILSDLRFIDDIRRENQLVFVETCYHDVFSVSLYERVSRDPANKDDRTHMLFVGAITCLCNEEDGAHVIIHIFTAPGFNEGSFSLALLLFVLLRVKIMYWSVNSILVGDETNTLCTSIGFHRNARQCKLSLHQSSLFFRSVRTFLRDIKKNLASSAAVYDSKQQKDKGREFVDENEESDGVDVEVKVEVEVEEAEDNIVTTVLKTLMSYFLFAAFLVASSLFFSKVVSVVPNSRFTY